MSIAHAAPSYSGSSPRWLLLGSLALNLFFIGGAIAMMVRAPEPTYDRNVFVRVDRLAATLPPADGEKLRTEINAHHAAVEDAQTKYRAAQDTIRLALRREPLDAAAMRAAMAQTRAARQNFDQAIQGVVASAAAQMSLAGRNALADWPPGRKK
ncbi:MAG: periplasmic heavy metal sensor [Pseudolabrys sp.]|jgi:uncharacterized membrane protein